MQAFCEQFWKLRGKSFLVGKDGQMIEDLLISQKSEDGDFSETNCLFFNNMHSIYFEFYEFCPL